MSLGRGSGIWTHTEDSLSTSGTDTLCLVGGRVVGANYTKSLYPVDGDIVNMRVELRTAPGVGKSRTFTLFRNGSSTALAVTISGTDTTGANMSDTILTNDNPGAYFEWRCTSTATPAASRVRISARFDTSGADNDYSYVFSGLTGLTKISAASEFISLAGDNAIAGATEAGTRCYVNGDGDLHSFSVRLDTNTPTKGDPTATRTFLLLKNGLVIGGGVSITFDSTDAAGTIKTVGSIAAAYSDGDYFTVQAIVNGTAPNDSYVSAAICLSADVDEFNVPATSITGRLPTGSTTDSLHLAKGFAVPGFQQTGCGMPWRGKKLRTVISQLPGGKGQAWIIQSPYGGSITYGPASANELVDTTLDRDRGVFDDLAYSIEAIAIDGAINSKFMFSLLLEPIPDRGGGMLGSHF